MSKDILKSVRSLIDYLGSDKNPLYGVWDEMRFDGIYTGNFEDPAYNWGGFGIIPISGFSDGDIAALYPIVGRPIQEYPVVRAPHSGDSTTVIAGSISSFIPNFILNTILDYGGDELDDLEKNKKQILSLATLLGDKQGVTAKILEEIKKEKILSSPSESERYMICDGKNSFITQYYLLLDDEKKSTDKKAWISLLKKFPFYNPAYYDLFEILSDIEKEKKQALEAAWNYLRGDITFACEYRDIKRAAKFLVEKGGEKNYGKNSEWEAIVAMSEQGACGGKWYECALKEKEKKNYKTAYTYFKNAAYWIGSDLEEYPATVRKHAFDCVKNLKDKNLFAIFEEIPMKEDKKKMDKILKQYAEIDKKKKESKDISKSMAPLFTAAKKGDLKLVSEYLNKISNINTKEEESGKTVLHYAVKFGHKEIVELLLNKGADLTVRMKTGLNTPLTLAANYGKLEIAKLLIEKGANVNEENGRNETPFFLACESGNLELAKLLLEKGSNINQRNISKETPIIIAANKDKDTIVSFLVEKGADLNAEDYSGTTALHWLAVAGKFDLVKLFINKGANPKIKDSNGETAIDWANKDYPEIAAFLSGKKIKETKWTISESEESILNDMAVKWEMSLKDLMKVDTLNFAYSDFSDSDMANIHLLPKLKTITLLGCKKISDKGLEVITRCKSLEELHLSQTNIKDESLEWIIKCKKLKKLWLDETKITSKSIPKIAIVNNLEWLRLNQINLKGADIQPLSALKKLKYLELANVSVFDEDLKFLKELKSLEQLDLSYTKITEKTIEQLTGLKNLENLNLTHTSIGESVFAAFSSIPKIQDIDLTDCSISGEKAGLLSKSKKLLRLNMSGTKVNDQTISQFTSIQSLKVLELENTKLTDSSISELKKMKHLNALILSKTKISSGAKKILFSAIKKDLTLEW